MASNLYLSDRGASTTINSLATQMNSGFIIMWAGSQPADANTNTSGGNYILGSVPFSTVAFLSASSNTITAQALTNTTAVSSGICQWYSAVTSSNTLRIIDGSFSTASADMNANTNNFAQGASIAVTSYSLTLPEH